MKRLIGLAFLFACTTAHSLEIKGIRPGLERKDVMSALPGAYCATLSKTTSGCSASGSFAGVDAEFFVMFYDEKVASVTVTFDSDEWGRVRDALLVKFGKPSKRGSQTLQNRMGAKFDAEWLQWNKVGNVLVAERFADKASESRVLLGSIEADKRSTQEAENRRRNDASDL